MTHIKNIGRFCESDKNAYILNDASLTKVESDFLMIIEEVVEMYQTHLGLDLHSIYIRGSVPRGLGIKGVSDLDTIAITNKKPKDIDLKWADKAEREINNKFSAVKGVEFSFYQIKDIIETAAFSIIPFIIKTQSVCVHGEDLISQIPGFRADKTIGNEHLIHLRNQIEQRKILQTMKTVKI